jgi:D-beta-D-heptose 7-phosphate kinase/D-beta-D-heptose 1-phosphate adenosyltransferase
MGNINKIVYSFNGKKIVVIGDVMLDESLRGEVSRISPEAPVPIVKIENESYDAGGSGNVASNLASMGAEVSLFGFVGRDFAGEKLEKIFLEKGIKTFFDFTQQTIRKSRVIGRGMQLIRYDYEQISEKSFSEHIIGMLRSECRIADAIIISDYAKGTITQELVDFLQDFKHKVIVDPKPANKMFYNDFFLITPNEKESLEMSGETDVKRAGEVLKKRYGSNVLITRGGEGMSLFSRKNVDIPTYAKEVFDVTGAGDTVVAALALSMAAEASLEEAAIIANHAAGIAVSKIGTHSVTLNELKIRISAGEKKIVSLGELKEVVKNRGNKKIVWTNGCFDLLHVGHIRYLKQAKSFGDILILGLNSDSSIKQLKGPGRPIQPEKERAEILASLDFIDYILIFQETRIDGYLKQLQPDIFAKGGDYNLNTIDQIERAAVESYGGKIKFGFREEGKSSTDIIRRIKKETQ